MSYGNAGPGLSCSRSRIRASIVRLIQPCDSEGTFNSLMSALTRHLRSHSPQVTLADRLRGVRG